jgi:hypothetical protein
MNPIDRAVMLVSTGLMFVGIVVLGVVEIAAGEPYGAAPVEVTNDAGEVVNTLYPAVDPNVRTGLVIAGLVILLVWSGYKLATPVGGASTGETTTREMA